MGWACGAFGWGEGVYRVLVGKQEGKRPLGRPRRRWVDNIRMDLQEVGCGYMDWIGLAQDRDRRQTLVSAVMNLRVPWNAWNFLTSCKPVSFSRRTLHHAVSNTRPDSDTNTCMSLLLLTGNTKTFTSGCVSRSAISLRSWENLCLYFKKRTSCVNTASVVPSVLPSVCDQGVATKTFVGFYKICQSVL